MRFNFLAGGEEVEITVARTDDGWLLNHGDNEIPLEAVLDSKGAWLVETHQGRRKLWVARRGQERLVFCEGKVHRLILPDPDDPAAEEPTGGPRMTADMPGKVVKLLVAVGDRVAVGQPVLIMESMKMESELTAPVAGHIESVHVEPGQIVGQGAPLVDIDPEIETPPDQEDPR